MELSMSRIQKSYCLHTFDIMIAMPIWLAFVAPIPSTARPALLDEKSSTHVAFGLKTKLMKQTFIFCYRLCWLDNKFITIGGPEDTCDTTAASTTHSTRVRRLPTIYGLNGHINKKDYKVIYFLWFQVIKHVYMRGNKAATLWYILYVYLTK